MDGGGKRNRKKSTPRGNRIQISNTKKPLYFYLNLTKKYMTNHNTIVLSGLGMAIPTVVTISEVMKRNEVSTQKVILTSTVSVKDENSGRMSCKSKMEIVMERGKNFENFKPKSKDLIEAKVGIAQDKTEKLDKPENIATSRTAYEKEGNISAESVSLFSSSTDATF